MKKSTINSKGFSLVELMVVIAIIAILAAIAIPAYSNYVLKAKFQDEIGKMDNYRKAIAIFIQDSGVTSDEEFQSKIANVKDNYFGDDNVAIMSELKQNNGRLLSHPKINDTTYQIAITPRINDSGTLVNWECDIRNETDNSAPPSGAMPRGCNVTAEDLNDDQSAYIQKFNDDLVGIRNAALNTISNDLSNKWSDLIDDDELSSDEGTIGNLNDKIATANSLMQAEIDKIIDASNKMADDFGISKYHVDNDYSNKLAELNTNENGVSNLQTELSSLETQRDNYEGAVTDPEYVDILNNISTKESDITTARFGQGLTELTEYRDSIGESNDGYTSANQAVIDRATEISNLTTTKTNYDNAQTERDVQSDLINNSTTGYNAQIDDRKGALHDDAKDITGYDAQVTNANQTFNDGLDGLNNNSAYSEDHVEKTTDASVSLTSTSLSTPLETN